jgi:type III restriction enzyme
VESVPILSSPEHLDTGAMKRFLWTGLTAVGKKTHLRRVACHNPYEKEFAEFLDGAGDVLRYVKNERFGFSVTYFENGRPRQYYPDFVAVVRGEDRRESFWVVETKGEVHPNTGLKRQAAEDWCRKMSRTQYWRWEYLFVQQRRFNQAMALRVTTLTGLAETIRSTTG